MDQKTATMVIALIVVLQIILTVLTFLQYPFIQYENQRNAGIFIAIILILLAISLHIYDRVFKAGENRTVEMESEGW